MRIFAIADLHLAFGVHKPMSVFGGLWEDYERKMAEIWQAHILPEDVVLIAGDISWAMRESEVIPDMAYLATLPGKKVLLKGNHDYWWSTKKKVQELAGPDVYVLQANAVEFPSFTVVGTRGWDLPNSVNYTGEDEKIFHREVERLRLSLEAGAKSKKPLIAMMHYPPLNADHEVTPFTTLFEHYQVTHCVYGHLHGHAHRLRIEGAVRGVQYHLVAADFLAFRPLELLF
ncbi:hypothetical protein BM613_00080 [Sulfoacidibacillus thermotolerans]|uniref:Calcineurin-like phosphoesterase domain-containing protein n=1 Tax=Sulfoacidibacillus thermotolerans TaxID=1765684 RepID=A0A2U3DCU1_SULT2|nr:hypothetical protein BM613_00080 [Sulfoacidibacillus thermotolerans]